jgi:hypothetical protein
MSDKPEVISQGGETPSENVTKEALDLMKKGVTGGIGEALKSFKDLSPEDRKALFGGAIALVGYLLLASQKGEEKKESEATSKTSESLASETKTGLEKVKKAVHAEKDITEKFDFSKTTPVLAPTPAPAPVQTSVPEVTRKPETLKQDDIFYVGDSYMDGVTTGRGISADNMDAVTSRPFISTGKKWEGNDVYIKAKTALDNPRFKTLVINGGLNDFYSSGNPEATYNRLVKGYGEIINIARSKGIKVVILDVAVIPKDHPKKAEVIDYTDRLNKWFRGQANVRVVDTTTTIAGAFTKDKTHATGKAYKRIYEKAQEAMA